MSWYEPVFAFFATLTLSQVDGVEVDVRSLRKALNLDREEGDTPSPVNQRAIIETLCAKSPQRLVAARYVLLFIPYRSIFVDHLTANFTSASSMRTSWKLFKLLSPVTRCSPSS
jgi:hypothetical protein